MQSPVPPEQRSDDLLASVRQVFAEKGFDGASMQDLARGAGISPGNFYRYFPSKAAIVEALVARDLDMLDRDFAQVRAADCPTQAARAMFLAQVTETTGEDCQIWAEIAAASMRKPEIAALAQMMHDRLLQHLLGIFAAISGLPATEVATRFRAQAELVLLLAKGCNLHRNLTGAAQNDLVQMLMQVLDRIIAEVSSPIAQPEKG